MTALDLEAIEERLAWANGIDLDENVARHYRQDVPALLAEIRRIGALAAPFQVGDPDPTPKFDPTGPLSCGERNPDGALHLQGAVAFCTWSLGHPDSWSHVAGSSDGLIVAVW